MGAPRDERALHLHTTREREEASRAWALAASGAAHAAVIGAAALLSLLWPVAPPPVHVDAIRVQLTGPPPPPPPPLPKGASLPPRAAGARSAATPVATSSALVVPRDETPPEPTPDTPGADLVAAGSESGSELGVPEGMEGGVPGGVVGGVPGGVLGGVVGGTGSGPVPALVYDEPARIVYKVKPVYPQDAFVKRLQGVVVIELVVDASGHVARIKILQSVPALDAAARDAVRQWRFVPARHQGYAVASIALAPIEFRIH